MNHISKISAFVQSCFLLFALSAAGFEPLNSLPTKGDTPIGSNIFGKSASSLDIFPDSGVKIQLESVYESLPSNGFAPIRVSIQNHSGSKRSWTLRSLGSNSSTGSQVNYRFVQTLVVDDKVAQTFEVLIPLHHMQQENGSFATIRISVAGYGVREGELSLTFNNAGDYAPATNTSLKMPSFIAMSEELALRSWSLLEKKFKAEKIAFHGSKVDIKLLPADWRGYLGLSNLWMTEQEWESLSQGVRGAVEDWIFQGGVLYMCTPQISLAKQSTSASGNKFPRMRKIGYGQIWYFPWDSKELDIERVSELHCSEASALTINNSWQGDYSNDWGLSKRVPQISLPTEYFFVTMLCYAIIVGPYNLFSLAHQRCRHRLFWTTPLIALSASVFLTLFVYLKDGLGGWGYQLIAVYLSAEQKQALILQEQISRTGLLTSQDFEVEEPAYIVPLKLRAQTETTALARSEETYTLSENRYSGDWFMNRHVQGQFLQTIRATRSRMELVNESAVIHDQAVPVLHSIINAPLEDVFYIDPFGSFWQVDGLAAGQTTGLVRSTFQTFRLHYEKVFSEAGPRLHRALEDAKPQPNTFYARTHRGDAIALETLNSVHWRDQTVIFFGPVASVRAEDAL